MNARSFLAELKQRNVYKVATAYVVAAWLLMQVASQIFPFFEIPNWTVRLVVVLLIIGFPVVLILAWAFELTPEGIKRAEDVGPSKSTAPNSRNLSAIVRGTRKQAMAFTTTDWSVVLEASGPTPAGQAAADKLCCTYWQPVYSYMRRQGIGPEEAKDFTQGFFGLLLGRRDLATVRKEKGRLRSYLLTSLKHFLTNERYRTMAIKRGKDRHLIPVDASCDRNHMDNAQADNLTADQIYERRWALTVLDHVLARLGDEYRAGGPASAGLFDRLQKSLTAESDRSLQSETANEFRMTERAVKEAFHRLHRRYRQLLREEIAHTVIVPGDIEDELRHLIAVLRAYPIHCHSHAMECNSA